MTVKIKFYKEKSRTLKRVEESIVFSSDFVEKLANAVKKENHSAHALGIEFVETAEKKKEGASFFVIEMEKPKKHEFLFELLPGEASKLVGVDVNLSIDHAKYLLSQIHKKQGVKLII